MAFTAYMFVKTEKGVIKGYSGEEDKTNDGKSLSNLSRVQAFEHGIAIPPHPQTGEPQDTPQHQPVVVDFEPDCAVAELYKAMAENQRVDEVKVYFFRSGTGERAGGKPDQLFHNWFTITLTDARIVGMELKKASGGEDAASVFAFMQRITFRYRKIEWEDHDDSKTAEYDWKRKAG